MKQYYEVALNTASLCKSFSDMKALGYKGPAKVFPHECGYDYSRDSSCDFYSGLVYQKLLFVFINKTLTLFSGMYALKDSSLPHAFTEILSSYRCLDEKDCFRTKDELISVYQDASEFGIVAAYPSLSCLWEMDQEPVTTNLVQQYTLRSKLWGSFLSLEETNQPLWNEMNRNYEECMKSIMHCKEVLDMPVYEDLNDTLCAGGYLDMDSGIKNDCYFTSFLLGMASDYSDSWYDSCEDDEEEEDNPEPNMSLDPDSVIHSGHISPYLDLACMVGDILIQNLNDRYHFCDEI